MTTAIAALGRFGPFFDVAELTSVPAGWRQVFELTTDRQLLAERVDAVRRALAGLAGRTPEQIPLRVAVSTAQLGVCARLAAPLLAAAVQDVGLGPLDQLYFEDRLGGPFPLGAIRHGDSEPDVVATIRPVVSAYLEAYSLSPQVAWGNVASALASAARMMLAVEADAGRRAVDLVSGLLSTAELQHCGHLADDGDFRRRSCCLIYRVASERTFCGDCVLAG